MKYLFLLSILLILAGCMSTTCENPSKTDTQPAKFTFETVPTGFGGCWVNKRYLDTLLLTKSPKAAQEVDGITMFLLPDSTNQEMTVIWNFHEGLIDTLRKFRNQFGRYSWDDNVLVNQIALVNGQIRFVNGSEKDVFIKIDNCIENAQETIVHALLFAGKYDFAGQKVIFSEAGEVQGLQPHTYYEVYIDYFDAGRQVDQIILGTHAENAKPHGFAFSGDTLTIYKLNCLESQDGQCMMVENGEILFQMIKNSD